MIKSEELRKELALVAMSAFLDASANIVQDAAFPTFSPEQITEKVWLAIVDKVLSHAESRVRKWYYEPGDDYSSEDVHDILDNYGHREMIHIQRSMALPDKYYVLFYEHEDDEEMKQKIFDSAAEANQFLEELSKNP